MRISLLSSTPITRIPTGIASTMEKIIHLSRFTYKQCASEDRNEKQQLSQSIAYQEKA